MSGLRLKPEQVLDIRAAHAAKTATIRDLAHRYDVGSDTIGLIVHEKTWRHLLPGAEPAPTLMPGAKLNDAKVRKILGGHKAGVSHSELARRFDVGESCIRAIVTGKSWRDIYRQVMAEAVKS